MIKIWEKKNNIKTLAKYVTRQNHFVIAKFNLKDKSGITCFPKICYWRANFKNSCSQMLFKRGILKNFAILEPLFHKLNYRRSFAEHLRCLLLDFRDSKQLGIYWRQSHRFLFRTPLKTQVKLQKQPTELFCKKRCS